MLDNDPAINVVSTACNGQLGVVEAGTKKPDVIILDIEMPVMDGITALPLILERSPDTKVIMFSTLTTNGADVTLKALSLGAVECLAKPTSQDPVDIGSAFEKRLVEMVKTLGGVNDAVKTSESFKFSAPGAKAEVKLHKDPMAYKGSPAIIAIGSSTGGPNALFEVCKSFKDLSIPVVITQHMPPTFTKMLATHIEQRCEVPTHEVEEGMLVEKGNIYVAQGGKHMILEKNDDGKTVIRLDDGPPVNFCKPAVDPMLNSAVEIYDRRVLGVILTGMGSDGIGGGEAIVKNHGRLIAQDEATSTVWGMPRAVSEAGYCSEILPLEAIGPWVRKQVTF